MQNLLKVQIIKHKQIIKFVISGGSAATCDLLLLALLHDYFKIDVVISGVIAFALAFVISFTLQKFWTFRDKDKKNIGQQLFMYLLVGITGLSVTALGLDFLVKKIHIHYILAQMIVGGSLAVFNFLIYKLVIFKKFLSRKKPKILIVTGIYPPEIGGPATIAEALFKELASRRFKVKVVTFGDAPKQKHVYQVSRHQNKILRYIKMTSLVWRLSINSDVIYSLGGIGTGLPCTIVKIFKPKKKFFLRVGGDYQWEQATQNRRLTVTTKDFLKNKLHNLPDLKNKLALDFILSRADQIIYNSEMLRDLHVKYRKVDYDKTIIIKNFIPKVQKLKLDKDTSEIRILFLGRLVFFKNFQNLILAFKQVLNKNKSLNLKLRIVGSGPELGEIEKIIKNNKLEKSISLVPSVHSKEKSQEYANADIFITPSTTEINANTVTEAKLFNKPIILTKYSESYYIGDNEQGMHYIDPMSKDDIVKTLQHVIESHSAGEFAKIEYSKSKIAWPTNKVLDTHIEAFIKS